jgi:transcriptional regulator with XRE-family HTH domain
VALRELMLEADESGEKLALGSRLARDTIYKWLRGAAEPSAESLGKVAHHLSKKLGREVTAESIGGLVIQEPTIDSQLNDLRKDLLLAKNRDDIYAVKDRLTVLEKRNSENLDLMKLSRVVQVSMDDRGDSIVYNSPPTSMSDASQSTMLPWLLTLTGLGALAAALIYFFK